MILKSLNYAHHTCHQSFPDCRLQPERHPCFESRALHAMRLTTRPKYQRQDMCCLSLLGPRFVQKLQRPALYGRQAAQAQMGQPPQPCISQLRQCIPQHLTGRPKRMAWVPAWRTAQQAQSASFPSPPAEEVDRLIWRKRHGDCRPWTSINRA